MPARKPFKKELETYTSLLRKALANLTDDIRLLESESFQSQESVESLEEGGTREYSRKVMLGLCERNEFSIRETMDVLRKPSQGEFGRWNAKARLQVVPHARNCTDCQRQAEEGVA